MVGLASPRVPASPRVASPRVQKVGLVPTLFLTRVVSELYISYAHWDYLNAAPCVCYNTTGNVPVIAEPRPRRLVAWPVGPRGVTSSVNRQGGQHLKKK